MLKAALCPNIMLRKRVTTVTFDIASVIVKDILSVVYHNLAVNVMRHAVNAVPALHERNERKGTHNVIADGR